MSSFPSSSSSIAASASFASSSSCPHLAGTSPLEILRSDLLHFFSQFFTISSFLDEISSDSSPISSTSSPASLSLRIVDFFLESVRQEAEAALSALPSSGEFGMSHFQTSSDFLSLFTCLSVCTNLDPLVSISASLTFLSSFQTQLLSRILSQSSSSPQSSFTLSHFSVPLHHQHFPDNGILCCVLMSYLENLYPNAVDFIERLFHCLRSDTPITIGIFLLLF